MKALKSLAVALTLVAATFGFASSVQAEPSRQASHYYVVGLNDTMLTVMPNAVEGTGTVRRAYVFAYLRQPLVSEGVTAQALWFLTEFNCQANTAQVITLDVVDQNANIVASIPGDEPARTPDDSSLMDNALDAACARPGEAVLVSQQEIGDLLVAYASAAAQAAQ